MPWDNRIIWYLISKSMPSLTPHNTTDFLDIDLKLNRFYLDQKDQSYSTKFWIIVDNIFHKSCYQEPMEKY